MLKGICVILAWSYSQLSKSKELWLFVQHFFGSFWPQAHFSWTHVSQLKDQFLGPWANIQPVGLCHLIWNENSRRDKYCCSLSLEKNPCTTSYLLGITFHLSLFALTPGSHLPFSLPHLFLGKDVQVSLAMVIIDWNHAITKEYYQPVNELTPFKGTVII